MNFEVLGEFDWYNEPENVRFDVDGMKVFAKPNTDFWQSLQRGFKKDDGHFFFCRKDKDFELVLKWKIENKQDLSQCGVMVRVDERNWCKAGVELEIKNELVLFSCLTTQGHSDWSKSFYLGNVEEVWFKIVRIEDEFEFFCSVDGVKFVKFKMVYLKNFEDVKVGAYISSVKGEEFFAELSDLSVNDI